MKIMNIENTDRFLQRLQECKGDVWLTTPEGDRLNLKSMLCVMVLTAGLLKKPLFGEMELTFSEPSDANVMIDFMMRG